jgi:hypothetical protein
MQDQGCAWIVNVDPITRCGSPRADKSMYCVEHHALEREPFHPKQLGQTYRPDGSRPPPAPELPKQPMSARLRKFLKSVLGA